MFSMFRRHATICISIAFVFCLAHSGIAQKAKPANKTRDSRQRLDRKTWVEKFLARLEAMPPEADASKDQEVVRLVTGYTWHAVPQAVGWLDATDPKAGRRKDNAPPKVLLSHARLIAHVMAREKEAQGLEALIDRMRSWTPQDWQAYGEAKSLEARAKRLYRSRAWTDARIQYLTAAKGYRNLGRSDREAGASYCAATCLYYRGKFRSAKKLYLNALELWKKLGNEADIAGSLSGMGNVLLSLGQYEEALEHYRHDLVLSEKIGIEALIARSLGNLSNAYSSLGRYEKALTCLHRALALFEKHGSKANIAGALNNLGSILSSLGQYEEAFEHHRRALVLRKKIGNKAKIASSLNNLGCVLSSLGRYEEALELHQDALVLRKKIGNRAHIATSLNNLGSVFSSLGRYEEALEHHHRALVLRRKIGNNAEIAYSLDNLGGVFHSLGRYEEALAHIRNALVLWKRIGNTPHIATSVKNLGNVFHSLGRYKKALEYHGRALVLREKIGNEANIASSLVGLGNVFHSLGRHEEALDHHRRALALQEKIGNEADIARSLGNLGTVFRSLGRYEEALERHRRALVLREKIGNEADIALSLSNLATVFHSLGRYEEALEHHRRALAIERKIGNEAHIALSLNNLGNVYYSLGRSEEALAHHRRALVLREKVGNEAEVAMSLGNLGNVILSLGRSEEALERHRRALVLREKIGNEADIASSLSNLGGAFHSLGRHEEALQHFRLALKFREKIANEDDIALSLNNLGCVFVTLGRHEEALEHFRLALAIRKKIGNVAHMAVSLSQLGAVLLLLGDFREARDHFARMLENVTVVREGLAADPDRVAFMDTQHGKLIPALEAALAEKAPDIVPDGPLAVRAVETLRGMATADLLQASLAEVQRPDTGPLAAEVVRLEHALDALERRVRKTYEASGVDEKRGPSEKRWNDLRTEQRELEKKWQHAVDQLRRSSPEWANLKRPEVVGLEELQTLLPKKTAYLAFALGKEGSFLLLVDREGLRHWRLPGKETIQTAVALHLGLLAREPAEGPDSGSVLETGRRLHELLLAPAEEALRRYETLLVSAEGQLWGLPLETLVTGGEGTNLRTAPYLLHRHAFTYVHSATVWDIHRKRQAKRRKACTSGDAAPPARTLVLADPIQPGEAGWTGKTLHLTYSSKRSEPVGRLPFTRVEGFSMATSLEGLDPEEWRFSVGGKPENPAGFQDRLEALGEPGAPRDVLLEGPGLTVRVGKPANREAFSEKALQDVRFLHLATHAHLDAESPGLSGLWLSPVDEEDPGFLRLADVMSLRLRAELVTLSGCETALGKATVSEGYQGLVRTFLFAGAENVLASAWRVNDAASAKLLAGLYASLEKGQTGAAAAVRDGKRDYLARVPAATPEKAHPYYWGAWMLWGTGTGSEH